MTIIFEKRMAKKQQPNSRMGEVETKLLVAKLKRNAPTLDCLESNR